MSAKHEVRLLRLAEDDLTEIVLYVAVDSTKSATGLMDKFNKKLALLGENPRIGSVPHEDSLRQLGYRYLLVDSYLIFYVIETPAVYVHRIIHGARDYINFL